MIETSTQTPNVNNTGHLKYANPRDLPSFPSSGLRPDGAAAGAAASLGWSKQKSIEPWTPNKSSSASTAAVLAKDYKSSPTWEPASSSAGAKAALLAAGAARTASPNKTVSPRSPQDAWGNSAATQAFNRSMSMQQTSPAKHTTTRNEDRSLAAARGAMSTSTSRPRAKSNPSVPLQKKSYPLESKAASNALSGAALAHRASMQAKPSISDVGAVSVTTMTRNMFTSNPPVKPEVDEKEANDKLHASAVAMARQMYSHQQKLTDQGNDVGNGDAGSSQPKKFVNLQDAAYKQAQERLAKLHQEHQQGQEFKDYYGDNTSAPRRRFTIGSKLRRKSSSDEIDDHQQSEKIRQQMSLFSSQLSEVDQKKRQQDRDALMATAQRNVKVRLQGMDQKFYNETGKTNPTMMSEWELKAHQAAQSSHDSRTQNKGKVDIGGGRFMSPDEVDMIASKRVQPFLDDINEKAEAERERLAALKMEEEARKAEQERQKTRDREMKELQKQMKEQEKQEERARRLQEKQEEKARKEEEKAAKAEQKRQGRDDRRRSQTEPAVIEDNPEHAVVADDDANPHAEHEQGEAPAVASIETNTANMDHEHQKLNDSSTSPTSKVKGWIKQRFSRGKSVGEQDKRKSFLGGAALKSPEANRSTASLDYRSTSMRDVALAGKAPSDQAESNDKDALRDSRGVSPVSAPDDDDDGRPGRALETQELSITPPRPIEDPMARTSSSPNRDSRFREMMDH